MPSREWVSIDDAIWAVAQERAGHRNGGVLLSQMKRAGQFIPDGHDGEPTAERALAWADEVWTEMIRSGWKPSEHDAACMAVLRRALEATGA